MSNKPIEVTPEALANPYEDCAFEPEFRLNVRVKTDDLLTIKSVSPSRGTIQHLIAGYVQSLAAELRDKGINFYSPATVAQFVAIVKRRNNWGTDVGPANPQPTRDEHHANVRTTAPGVYKGITNPPRKSAGVSRKVGKGNQRNEKEGHND